MTNAAVGMLMVFVSGISFGVGITALAQRHADAQRICVKTTTAEPVMPTALPPGYKVGPTGVILHIEVPD